MPPHSSFQLPGALSRGFESYAIASGIVHSGQFNIRGLESHSYAFWDMSLQDLVTDLAPTVVVIPQFVLDVFQVKHDNSIGLHDSIASLPQSNVDMLIPDFVLVVVRAILRDNGVKIVPRVLSQFTHWNDVQIEVLRVGLLAELKRRPTRSAPNSEVFVENLYSRLSEASSALERQAREASRAHYETKCFILLACAGEWWSWKLAVCEDYYTDGDGEEKPEPRRVVVQKDTSKGKAASKETQGTQNPAPPPLSLDRAGSDNESTPEQGGHSRQRTAKTKAIAKGFAEPPSPPADNEWEKVPYNRNENPKPPRRQNDEEEPKPPANPPKKARFRHYGPAELRDMHLPVQGLLTEADFANPNLFRTRWSFPILSGTQESSQNWYIIHRFLEDANTRVNGLDIDQDDDQPGRPRRRRPDTDGDATDEDDEWDGLDEGVDDEEGPEAGKNGDNVDKEGAGDGRNGKDHDSNDN